MRQRVLAYVTRERRGRMELLVFDLVGDPDAGTQVPAGRVNEGEDVQAALRRELVEEAGLEDVRIGRELPIMGAWVERSRHENHAFEVHIDPGARDAWDHEVGGDGDDAGLVFRYRWVPVDSDPKLWNGDLTYTQLRRERARPSASAAPDQRPTS